MDVCCQSEAEKWRVHCNSISCYRSEGIVCLWVRQQVRIKFVSIDLAVITITSNRPLKQFAWYKNQVWTRYTRLCGGHVQKRVGHIWASDACSRFMHLASSHRSCRYTIRVCEWLSGGNIGDNGHHVDATRTAELTIFRIALNPEICIVDGRTWVIEVHNRIWTARVSSTPPTSRHWFPSAEREWKHKQWKWNTWAYRFLCSGKDK